MSVSDQTPLTRRAVREAARATGEQPILTGATATGGAPRFDAPASADVAPAATGEQQPLTRRRLRELRAQGIATGEVAVTGVVELEPEQTFEPERTIEPAPVAEPESSVVAPTVEAEPVIETTHPRDTAPQPPIAFSPPAVAESAEPRSGWAAPEGHWTRQLEIEDEEELLETTFSREVRAASPTTSALIIPAAPAAMNLGGPLDSTGEILLTGSIPLSPSLATTGAIERHPAVEDDRFDDQRLHDSAQDAQPVRAAAIASQHALGTPIVSDGKTRSGRGLTILLIAASSLAVVVTGVVVAALVLRWI